MNFENAARTYDNYAVVQNKSADILFDLITKHYPKQPKKILEIGCGTGYLTEKIVKYYPFSTYYANDAARAMLEQCKQKVGFKPIHYIKGRAETINLSADLIVSNFGMHWLNSFGCALKKFWHHTNNSLFFAIPIEGTFKSWYEKLESLQIKNTPFPFITEDRLRWLINYINPLYQDLTIVDIQQEYKTVYEFLETLNHLGINSYPFGKVIDIRPLIPYFKQNLTINYKIAFCILRRFKDKTLPPEQNQSTHANSAKHFLSDVLQSLQFKL